jgi:hypothetical protein
MMDINQAIQDGAASVAPYVGLGTDATDQAIIDCLTNLMHFAYDAGIEDYTFDELIETARKHYHAEQREVEG